MSTQKKFKSGSAAFTIVELLVVMGIFVIISGTVIFNYTHFKSSATIENLAQDIALTVRKAQVFALGVKGAGPVGTVVFPGYGVHFSLPASTPPPPQGSSKSFVFFADVPNVGTPLKPDGEYTNTTSACNGAAPIRDEECMDIISIETTDVITSLCHDTTCEDASLEPSLDIIFNRPEPEAHFCFKDTNNSSCLPGISNASIKVMSASNVTKVITVWNTGQIVVK